MCLHFTRLLGTLHITPPRPQAMCARCALLVAPHSRCAFILQGCWEHYTLHSSCPRPCVPDALLVSPQSECAFILQGCWEHYTLHLHAPGHVCQTEQKVHRYVLGEGMLPMASHPNLRVVVGGPQDHHAFPQTC